MVVAVAVRSSALAARGVWSMEFECFAFLTCALCISQPACLPACSLLLESALAILGGSCECVCECVCVTVGVGVFVTRWVHRGLLACMVTVMARHVAGGRRQAAGSGSAVQCCIIQSE